MLPSLHRTLKNQNTGYASEIDIISLHYYIGNVSLFSYPFYFSFFCIIRILVSLFKSLKQGREQRNKLPPFPSPQVLR